MMIKDFRTLKADVLVTEFPASAKCVLITANNVY